ncbi:hypothetical protein KSC_000400 [Ktedonobacter sp. SOSP1-52]|uniref:hypothetical protein n=1 Tax=Ktedonobacter sp. SOSP1-52 TaxID=2778366 RepID=UPI0019167A0E|nr:hypothetical protein [Ktedonobacter sp. SOSP1-52]GHO61148.1 hypothetical protein KSC_000400 [Ktedonobacter sp. SOSP1-52]
MKQRQWSIRRQVVQTADAQRRWDQAYHFLVRWSAVSQEEVPQEASEQERSDERSHVCARFDATTGTNANH